MAALSLIDSPATVFTIDSSRSSISLSGSVLGNAFQEQRTGSLTTKFEGTINADVTASSIVFTGASLVTAQNSGSWEPKAGGEAGSELANYGGKASAGLLGSAVAAVRNTQLDVTSLRLTLSNGQFSSGGLLFQFLPTSKGALDYSVAGFVPLKGSIPLAGMGTNRVTAQATLTTNGNVQTLTIPVTADFFFKLVSANDTVLTLNGQIVATRTLSPGGGTTTGSVLFSDDFQRTTLGSDWTVVDDTPVSAGPSKWYVQSGTLFQDSNIYKNAGLVGTHIVTGAAAWSDYAVTAVVTPTDNDGWGLIVRYQDSSNYYRFFTILDSANGGPFLRLEKFVNGAPATLAEVKQAYTQGVSQVVCVEAVGNRLTVWLDGKEALTATDSAFVRGKAGFCTYASSIEVRQVRVRTGANTAPTVQLAAPSADTLFFAPANVALKAVASDADGAVAKVEFHQGTSKLGEAGRPWFTFTATNLSAGTHTFAARAIDGEGSASAISSPLTVQVRPAETSPVITGQWDFDQGDLRATVGNDLDYFDLHQQRGRHRHQQRVPGQRHVWRVAPHRAGRGPDDAGGGEIRRWRQGWGANPE